MGDPGFEPPRMPHHDLELADQPDRTRDTDALIVRAEVRHSRAKIAGITAAAMVALAVLVTVLLVWGPGSPLAQPAPTPSGTTASSPVSTEPPALPERFDTWTREEAATLPPSTDDELRAATAVYTQNGQPSVLLIVARPVADMEQFLLSLGAGEITPIGSGWCAAYDGQPLCGVVRGDTGWAVSPLADQDRNVLVRIAVKAAEAG